MEKYGYILLVTLKLWKQSKPWFPLPPKSSYILWYFPALEVIFSYLLFFPKLLSSLGHGRSDAASQ